MCTSISRSAGTVPPGTQVVETHGVRYNPPSTLQLSHLPWPGRRCRWLGRYPGPALVSCACPFLNWRSLADPSHLTRPRGALGPVHHPSSSLRNAAEKPCLVLCVAYCPPHPPSSLHSVPSPLHPNPDAHNPPASWSLGLDLAGATREYKPRSQPPAPWRVETLLASKPRYLGARPARQGIIKSVYLSVCLHLRAIGSAA